MAQSAVERWPRLFNPMKPLLVLVVVPVVLVVVPVVLVVVPVVLVVVPVVLVVVPVVVVPVVLVVVPVVEVVVPVVIGIEFRGLKTMGTFKPLVAPASAADRVR